MLPLLFPLILADTVVVEPDFEYVSVHEWGVVELRQRSMDATGARWGCLSPDGTIGDYIPSEVEAPVIWFHGPDVTGDFTVTVPAGLITTTLPSPDESGLVEIPTSNQSDRPPVSRHRMVWRDLSISWMETERRIAEEHLPFAEDLPFAWAIPYWRDVPSLTIRRDSDGWQDGFLYYECTAYPVCDTTGRLQSIQPRGDGLLFSRSGDLDMTCHLVDLDGETPESLRADITRSEILSVLCEWGRNNLTSEEIEALWRTWEPCVRTRCLEEAPDILMFPLEPEAVESISSIELRIDQGYGVTYHRLFVALAEI